MLLGLLRLNRAVGEALFGKSGKLSLLLRYLRLYVMLQVGVVNSCLQKTS